MQIGLLGKANVGKSTFFSAATETVVQTGNFPFTTIEPNIGVTHVKVDCACKNLENRCGNNLCLDGIRFIPVKPVFPISTSTCAIVPTKELKNLVISQFFE